jgi:hypothetical protein
MTTLSHDQITEVEPHFFVTEASDLGLRPGEWPVKIQTEVGNGQSLVRASKKVDAEGDLLWVTYVQTLGCVRVRIYND